MRTTLEIDDAVLAAARALASQERLSLGAAVSRLALRGLRTGPEVRRVNGFPAFEAGPDAAPITLEVVQANRDG